MRKYTKLRISNWILLAVATATLASSIQLEAHLYSGYDALWFHIYIASLFVLLTILHLYLHFGWRKWLSKVKQLKSSATRILWWFFLATSISGIIALIHALSTYTHGAIEIIHGKIGLIMLALAIYHIVRRHKHLSPK